MTNGAKILTAVLAMAAAGAAWGELVDVEVARGVAQEQVERSFPGEAWVCWGDAEVESAAEGIAARAFFFGLAGSGWDDEEAVRAAVLAGMDGEDGESELYANTATVLTGANDTDSLVLRHFRGVPGWWMETVRSGGTAMMLNAGDVRRVTSVAPRGGSSPKAKLKAIRAARDAEAAARMESLPSAWREKAAEAEAEAAEAHRGAWAAAKKQLDDVEGDK
jgi:hypothetical protein